MRVICSKCQRVWYFRRKRGSKLSEASCSECQGQLHKAPARTIGIAFGLGTPRQERIDAALQLINENPNCPNQSAERTLELEDWGQ